MAIYKDTNGKWFVSVYYKNWKGETSRKVKRGFTAKREAAEWEREFLLQSSSNLDMDFQSFVVLYQKDLKNRIRLNTWQTKISIIENKILPYFANKKMNEIKPTDVISWQNSMIEQGFSKTYLKSMHNQLSAIFNHAIRFYDLKSNPAAKAGNMGKKESEREMLFWTKDEYLQFADAMMDKPVSYFAFEILYWCGLRLGELLALTKADFNFEKQTIRINKSYQRINGQDIITDPKTPKSNRLVQMPDFLSESIKEHLSTIYKLKDNVRIFQITKSFLHHEMARGCKEVGTKKIRIHDLRHSHVSLLIDMGFSAVAIANRVGHESIDITFRYAHMFPTVQADIANKLNIERGA
jgi:integrase